MSMYYVTSIVYLYVPIYTTHVHVLCFHYSVCVHPYNVSILHVYMCSIDRHIEV